MSSNGLSSRDTLAELVERPYEFDFVQAVHTIQRKTGSDISASSMVGYDSEIKNESIRFRVASTLRSVSSQVIKVTPDDESECYEIVVPFIGLTGVNGVLPRHYTQALIRRIKQHDYAMRDFYDLFHHRIVSLFFRASTKYRLPYVYQSNAVRSPKTDDTITDKLYCLTGLGHSQLKHKRAINDTSTLTFGGHFADTKPTGHSLERMIGAFVGIPAKVKQFQFEWLYVDPAEQTRLTPGAPCRLGEDIIIGERVPSFQSRFRIVVGAVGWQDFLKLLPNSKKVQQLADLVRSYVGISLDFDLQVIVDGKEIPPLLFSNQNPPQLGWTTWMFSEPVDEEIDDAVFDISQFKNS